MAKYPLDFEKPLDELIRRIRELEELSLDGGGQYEDEIRRLRRKLDKLGKEIFGDLTPWQKTQLARHIERPYPVDYFRRMLDGFLEIHGDRRFGDDHSVLGGIGMLDGKPLVVIGHQKGRDTKSKIKYNFGMPNPEGYRKALRLMKLAEKFGRPVLTMIDTPGAYPGIGAEERGQALAIAENLREMSCLRVPIVAVVTGEGGSGGALALGVGDRVLMLEYSVYSVISPESCAAILWRDSSKAPEAADPLRLTARDAYRFRIVDEIVPEPLGGAHRDPQKMAAALKEVIKRHLQELQSLPLEKLLEQRYNKYRQMGEYGE